MAVNVNGGALEFDAVINASQFNAAISAIENQLAGLTASAERQSSAIEKVVNRSTQAIAAYTGFISTSSFIQDIVSVRGEFQQLEVAFSTMLQSKDKADKLMSQVTELAATTPFELKDVAGATKQLLAFGISADDVVPTLRSLGDVASGIGAPLGDIAYLFGTIKTQGVAMTQDIRQFAQRGIPIYDELAKILGVSTEKVGEFITAGKVGFPEIQKVFQNLTAEGSKFGGLMEAQSKTLTGQLSNLRDAWGQMLNELGKDGQNVFGDIINSATFLVKNFRTVLDILKELVLVYGTYKAVVMATAAVQFISANAVKVYSVATKELSIAQTLQATASAIANRAATILNTTLLANPYALAAAGIAGLIGAMVLLTRTTNNQEEAQKSLNEANQKFKDDLDTLKNRTSELVGIISNETSTRFAQVQAFDELKKLYPEVLRNMDLMGFKTLSNEKAQKQFNEQIDKMSITNLQDQYQKATAEAAKYAAQIKDIQDNHIPYQDASKLSDFLEQAKEKARLLAIQIDDYNQKLFEANTPIADQIKHFEGIRGKLIEQRDQVEKNITKMKEMGVSALDFRMQLEGTNLTNLNLQIDNLLSKVNALKGVGLNPVKDKSFFTKQKGDAQAVIDSLDVNDKNFNKRKAEQAKIIRDAEKELAKFDVSQRSLNAATAAANKLQTELNALLEKRKGLLKDIADQVRNADQSGMPKDQSELDKINEKYDNLIANITEYNAKVEEFNKKNSKNPAQKVGQADILQLNAARTKELTNAQLEEQAQAFKKNLQEQLTAYQQYEDAKKEVGIKKAQELFGDQAKGFETMLKDLQLLQLALLPKVQLGIASESDMTKFKAVSDAIQAINDKRHQDEMEANKKTYLDLLATTVTFNAKRKEINERYDKLEAELQKNSDIGEVESRMKILKQGREDELNGITSTAARATELYRKLNQDILTFTRERLKEEVKALKERLKTDTTLTPQQKQDIQNTIDQYKGLLDSTNETARGFGKAAKALGDVANIFGDLGSALEGVNSGLADTLNTMGQLASIGANAASATGKFISGDIVGGIGDTVKVITGIINIFKQVKESQKKAEEDFQAFQTKVLQGEIAITEEVRNRQREQVKLNKLKLEGLEAEKKLLLEQRDAAAAQYADILQKLQQETFISQVDKQKFGGFLGIGRKTRAVEVRQTLNGMTFDQMEQLFSQGRLTGKAKDLFELLQKIKQEGADIDGLLKENAQAAKEIFTGTTTEGISDAIIEGFKNGKKGITDFAGTFEDLMRNALIQSLKFKYLEGPLQDFFDQFAAATESGGQLTGGEITQLQNLFNNIINNANSQFQQLQQIAGLNFNSSSTAPNSLTGAIKGITEGQAELLAGQFGGLRITALETLSVNKRSLDVLNAIQTNTGIQISKLTDLIAKFSAYETGQKKLYVQM